MRGGNINPFKFELKPDDLYVPSELVNNNIFLQINDLITPAVTSLENIGKIAKINTELENTTIGGFVYLFRPYVYDSNISDYLLAIMSSHSFIQFMKNITKKSGQAFYNMNKERLKKLFLPLAPYNEQIRIINKFSSFEQLLEQYNKLEKQLTKLENEITDKLKKSILQYAIEGKLVKQDPNDEPASVLLERIKAEKEKLIKEGKIKRDKNESYIYQGDDKNYYEKINGKISNINKEIPFNIPNYWCWTRLPNIIYYCLGKTPDRHNKMFWENGTYNWISISDMKDREIILDSNEKITDLALKSCFNNKISPAGTLLMSFKLTVGRVSVLGIDSVHNEAIVSIIPFIDSNNITRNFLMYSLGRLIQYCETTDAIKGATLNKEKINRLLIPFPPLNEQHKICMKIVNLFDNIK